MGWSAGGRMHGAQITSERNTGAAARAQTAVLCSRRAELEGMTTIMSAAS